MGTLVENAIGTMPLHRSAEFPAWVQAAKKHKLRNLNSLSDYSEAFTFYLDSVGGNDANDGINGAVQGMSRLHDVVNAISDTNMAIRVRVKRGTEYTGLGKNYEWDTDHYAAFHSQDRQIRIDTYGSGRPPVFHSGDKITASWTQDGGNDSWYVDSTSFPTVSHIYEHNPDGAWGHETTIFTEESSLANCNSTPRSFFYDSGNDRVYVNTDGSNPGEYIWYSPDNIVTCWRLDHCDAVVDLGDGIGYGWGIEEANSHAYFVGLGAYDDNEILLANARAYYGSAHLMGEWIRTGLNRSGGIVTLYRCGGGGNIKDVAGQNLTNFFQDDGSLEGFAIECYVDKLPRDRTDWPKTVGGHTDGVADNGIIAMIDCNTNGGFSVSSLPTNSDDHDGFIGFVYNCNFGLRNNRINNLAFPAKTSIINSKFFFGGALSETLGWVSIGTTTGSDGALFCAFYNTIFDAVNSTISGNNGVGILSGNSLLHDTRFYHCLFLYNNTSNATRGLGFSGNQVAANADTFSIGITRNSLIVNDGSNIVVPGLTDSTDAQINNGYYNVEDDPLRELAGYNTVTNAIELNSKPVTTDEISIEPSFSSELGIGKHLIGYDINGNFRGFTTTLGPWESLTVLNSQKDPRDTKDPYF